MFNEYIWNTYLNAGGRKITELFEKNLTPDLSEEYVNTMIELRSAYCPEQQIIQESKEQLQDLEKDLHDDFGLLDEGEYTIESALDFVYDYIKGEDDYTPQNIFACFSDSIEYITTALAIELPEMFVPYYFKYNFNILEKIASEFEIDLPDIPVKKDYEGRFYYYGALCAVLWEFREKHNMSPYELCAFLYDFAPKYIGGIKSYIIEELPEPKSAYFIGGSKDDRFLTNDVNAVSCWQCNPDTCAGDMIVMYLRTPVSAIDSIWRSVSVGFNDPFFYYYRCTYIAKPKGLKRITLKQLHQDAFFKDLPIVRKNMQGINGVELLPSVYNHLLDITGCDVQRLEYIIEEKGTSYLREKDVENNLVKPFLKKLGYEDEEYQQQLYIEIGNHNHALIPDFVIHPVVTSGHQSGEFLVEAKLTISSNKVLEETKKQARSYAKLLNAKYSVLASKEGIWISKSDDDYTKDILVFSWAELKNEDNFFKVFKIIGNGKI